MDILIAEIQQLRLIPLLPEKSKKIYYRNQKDVVLTVLEDVR
jgi:hypothetical protein